MSTVSLCKGCGTVHPDVWHKDQGYCKECSIDYHSKELWQYYLLSRKTKMTPDDLYSAGYEDGKAGKAMNASHMVDPNYTMGYEDGKGDRVIERPVEAEYTAFNDAPEGFEFTGQKRVPKPYEFYLSKGGSATYLTRERKNNQTRHILKCIRCNDSLSYNNPIYGTGCIHHPEVKGRD